MNLAAPLPEALLVPAVLAGVAVASRAVSLAGAGTGLVLAVVVYLGAGRGGFAALTTFVVLGSAATWLGRHRKEKLGIAQADKGRRGPLHALANCAVATAAALAMLAAGQPDWLAFVLVGSLATALCDTLGTEVGQAFGAKPFTLYPPRRVPPGTPGAVSLPGTLAGVAGACLVSLSAAVFGLLPYSLLWTPTVAAAIAAALESLLRQTALSNRSGHWSNLLNTAIGGALAAFLSQFIR